MSDPILDVRHLTREVGEGNERKRLVDDITISFERGKIYTIMGPSGAGKSSLLRLLNRLDEPTSGEVIFDSKDYRHHAPCDIRRQISYVFQVPYLFDGTVADNLRQAEADIDDDRMASLMRTVVLDPDLLQRDGDKLSVGQQHRVTLARALATQPSVVLLDEPTASLDPTYTERIEESITCLAEQSNLAVIMVSHHPNQAVRLNGQGVLLVAGRLVETGPARQLVEKPQTDLGRQYRDKELQ